MRRAIAAGTVLAALAAALVIVQCHPWFAAEQRTAIRLRLVDEGGQSIERARVEFETEERETLAVQELASGRWVPVGPTPAKEGWGRRVAQVHVRAFDCDRRQAVRVERRSHGARFGRFAPHPVPLTHVYEVSGEVRCPLPQAGGRTGPALELLVRDLSRGEPWSYGAARELLRIGPAAAPALAEIVDVIESGGSDSIRADLVRAIGAMKQAGRPAAKTLFSLLDDPSPSFRRIAASALEGLGGETPGLVTQLSAAARRDPDPYVQQHILGILGRMGPVARSAERDLAAILASESEEESVRLAAFWALGKLDTPGGHAARRRYAAEHPILYSH